MGCGRSYSEKVVRLLGGKINRSFLITDFASQIQHDLPSAEAKARSSNSCTRSLSDMLNIALWLYLKLYIEGGRAADVGKSRDRRSDHTRSYEGVD